MSYILSTEDGQQFIVEGFALIGRSPDPNIFEGASIIKVQDGTHTISKTHAAIAVSAEGKFLVEDLNSTNGTFVANAASPTEIEVKNGEPLEVQPGDRIRLGEVTITVSVA